MAEPIRPSEVVARRRRDREALLDLARELVAGLDDALGARGVVVFGSVARGDFHHASDVDVLVVADHLPDDPRERLRSVGPHPSRVAPVAWTPDEWERRLARKDPIAVEASDRGVWLLGGRQDVSPSS